jgi:hypothetical protein
MAGFGRPLPPVPADGEQSLKLISSRKQKAQMKHITTMALMLNLAIASVYAQPSNPTLSGTATPSTVDLGTGTPTSEYNLAGNGMLGQFTLRVVSASAATPEQSSSCSGLYVTVLAGQGVFRYQDGSLLMVDLTGGSDCIDLAAGKALCIRIFQVTGGTGRFRQASGNNITLTMTVVPAVPGKFVFFAVTADMTGTISRMATEEDSQDAQR